MAGRKGRTPDQIAEQRAELARLYSTGWTLGRIAAKQGLSLRQITYDLAKVRKEWRDQRHEYIQAAVDQELARIDATESQAWRGWRRSLRDAVKVRTERPASPAGPDAEAPGPKVVEDRAGQAGDPRFLQVVLSCVERRCRLLGLDAPAKTLDLTLDDLRSLNDDELTAIAEGRPLPRRDAGAGGTTPATPPA